MTMSVHKAGNPLFPVFLKLDTIVTLIVGGGNVGLEKLEALLKNDPQAHIRLVGREIRQEIRELSGRHNIVLFEREFQDNDLNDISLLILATDSRELHVYIHGLAQKRQLLVNVADTPDLCDFYLGSTVKKGNLKIGISTNGQSPTLAKRLREILEESLPEEINELLDNLKNFRNQLKGDFTEKVRRLNDLTSDLTKKNQ